MLHSFPVLLPILSATALFAVLRRRVSPWQLAVVLTILILSLWVVIVNEVLSVSLSLTRANVIGAWTIFLFITGGLWVLERPARRELRERKWSVIAGVGVVVLPMALILGSLLTIAIVSPPNNWDSMTYHMARVCHWMQDQTIAHFPTQIGRQDFMPPLAEWFILHTMLLTGTDSLANAVQWAALCGCMVCVSWIADLIGAGRWGILLASVFCLTLPTAILESTSTQNDLVAALFLGCFVGLSFQLLIHGPRPWSIAACGAALGLALLSKGTVLLFAAPAGVMLAIVLTYQRRVNGASVAMVVACVGFAIASPHFMRNYATCGNAFGPGKEDPNSDADWKYATEVHNPKSTASNVIRGVAVQLALPDWRRITGWPAIDVGINAWLSQTFPNANVETRNAVVAEWGKWLHEHIGADPDDPRTTWGNQKFHVDTAWNHEDISGNPLHTALLAAAAVIIPFPRWRRRRFGVLLVAMIVGMMLMFCLVLRWQIWHTRLLLPILIMGAPIFGACFEAAFTKWMTVPAALALLLISIPWVINNESRPVFGWMPGDQPTGLFAENRSIFMLSREQIMFRNRQNLQLRYAAVVDELKRHGVRRVGLHTNIDDWEYPFWTTCRDRGLDVEIHHTFVTNETAPLLQSARFKDFRPDVTVRMFGDLTIETR